MTRVQEKCGATAIVDIATLTGACMIALGGEIAGLFTPTDSAAAEVVAAAKVAGAWCWCSFRVLSQYLLDS